LSSGPSTSFGSAGASASAEAEENLDFETKVSTEKEKSKVRKLFFKVFGQSQALKAKIEDKNNKKETVDIPETVEPEVDPLAGWEGIRIKNSLAEGFEPVNLE
jgi:hypothetical protein